MEDDDIMAVSAQQREEVEAMLRRQDLAPRHRERLEMVKGVLLGQDLPTIARWSGRSPRTIRHWLRRYHKEAPQESIGGIEQRHGVPTHLKHPAAEAGKEVAEALRDIVVMVAGEAAKRSMGKGTDRASRACA